MNKYRSSAPTPMFWNFVGVAIVILAVSMFRATNFKVEAANQKLEVNRAVDRAKRVVTDLERSPVPETEKQKLRTAKEELEATQQEILTNETDRENSEGEI